MTTSPPSDPAGSPEDGPARSESPLPAEAGGSGPPPGDRSGRRLAGVRRLQASDLQVRKRRTLLPIMLFAATCLSTWYVGATGWDPIRHLERLPSFGRGVGLDWQQGAVYMAAVLAILLTHEMGHFIAAVIYRIPASYPIFLPLPFNPVGTLGAIIGIDGLRGNRKQIFDLGIAGPLAGLVVAVPVLWVGITQLEINGNPGYGFTLHNPLLIQFMIRLLRPELVDVGSITTSQLNPWFMAGWVGMLITGLNMLPISQLDGGHTIYALFCHRAHRIARAFLIAAIAFVIVEEVYLWTLMLVLIIFIGTDHPPTSDDSVPLGRVRWALGLASLLIPLLCFPPYGIDPY